MIVGGGVVGLSIGWRLASAGRAVVVLERDGEDAAPTGAWWAAAGMLAPLAEAGFEDTALLALNVASAIRYPEFVGELEAASGIRVDYRREGTYTVAASRDDAAWLRRQFEHQRSMGFDSTWISGAEAREAEPHLSPRVVAAIHTPADHQVDNRLLRMALTAAFTRAGGEIRWELEAVGVEVDGAGVCGIRARSPRCQEKGGSEERIAARQVVVCAGAWSPSVLQTLPGPAAPIRPVKGQLLALGLTDDVRLDHVVRSRAVYLAPKGDGRLVVGATTEEAGFDVTVTAGAVLDLLREAWEIVPSIRDLTLLDSWSGLRPASPDHAPILGATQIRGLFVACAHYRNGILLTPITAYAMADLLLNGDVFPLIEPFSPRRFAPARRFVTLEAAR